MQPSGNVTLLFTDIEASTRLLQQLGDERYALALDEHRQLLRAAFATHDGYEVNCEGDSFFFAFPSADGAVAAAERAQRGLARYRWPDALPVRVRMGIHSGRPMPAPPKYVGLDVHCAARVMAAAHGGQVVVTAATRELNDSRFGFRDLGEHELKDIPAPTHLFQLEAEGLESEFPPLRTLANRPTNLPAPPRPLLGRMHELAVLEDLLSDQQVRLVTLTGPGGTGKTRLALEAARAALELFRGGVFVVRLAPVRDGGLLPQTIAHTLGVRELPGETLLDTVADYLRTRELLLLLDNFEQIAEAAPALTTLLEQAPKLKLLVTSRVRLRLGTERVLRVAPLETPPLDASAQTLGEFPASALFLERLVAADPGFVLDGAAAPAVAELCVRLDGLPLALELAAARAALVSPQELLARLGHRLDALGSAGPDTDERQRTLRATLAWSYDLLPADAQTLYATLAVFPDGWTLDAAEAIADEHTDTAGALEALLDGSLVNRRLDDGSSRFKMFETIREHALECLHDRGREQVARDRLLRYACALAEREAGQFGTAYSWYRLVSREQELFRAAVGWGLESGQTDRTLSLWQRIHLAWRDLWVGEVAAWGAELVERTHARRGLERVALLQGMIDIESRRTSALALRAQAYDSLELARELGDPVRLAWGLMYVSGFEVRHDPERAHRLIDEAVELAEQTDSETLFQMLMNRVSLSLADDRRDKAVADAAAILALARSMGRFKILSLGLNALVALRVGDLERALAFGLEAHESQATSPSVHNQALASEVLGLVYLFRGEDALAAKELRSSFRLHRMAGWEHEPRWVLYALAAATAATDPERALVLRAAAGDLESFVPPERRVEARTLERRLATLERTDAGARARLEAIGQRMTRDEVVAYATTARTS
jgi:predicted ATPase/class 3 adenylate cyclase